MTLRDVSVGQTVKVTRLNGDGPVKRRIMDMGITKGVEVISMNKGESNGYKLSSKNEKV